MDETKVWYVRTESGEVYGPSSLETLAKWAREGRIEPTGFASRDRKTWTPLELVPELEMKWFVETAPGSVFGPFNRELVIRLFKEGQVPAGARAYRLHELPIDEDPPPVVVERRVERRPAPSSASHPARSRGSIFDGLDFDKLAALESAAQREISRGRQLGLADGVFGRR